MGPSCIRRDSIVPLRTRTLSNGSIVVTNAYEGKLYFGDVFVADIKGIRVTDPVTGEERSSIRDEDVPEGDAR